MNPMWKSYSVQVQMERRLSTTQTNAALKLLLTLTTDTMGDFPAPTGMCVNPEDGKPNEPVALCIEWQLPKVYFDVEVSPDGTVTWFHAKP